MREISNQQVLLPWIPLSGCPRHLRRVGAQTRRPAVQAANAERSHCGLGPSTTQHERLPPRVCDGSRRLRYPSARPHLRWARPPGRCACPTNRRTIAMRSFAPSTMSSRSSLLPGADRPVAHAAPCAKQRRGADGCRAGSHRLSEWRRQTGRMPDRVMFVQLKTGYDIDQAPARGGSTHLLRVATRTRSLRQVSSPCSPPTTGHEPVLAT